MFSISLLKCFIIHFQISQASFRGAPVVCADIREAFQLLEAPDTVDSYFRRQHLPVRRMSMDFSHNVHSVHYLTECGKPLSVRVSFSSIIEFRLVAYTDKKF